MSLLTDEEWESFKTKHGKSYPDAAEEAMRRDLLEKSKKFIEEHNKKYEAGEVSFVCGLNSFSDATPEEMSRRCGCRKPPTTD